MTLENQNRSIGSVGQNPVSPSHDVSQNASQTHQILTMLLSSVESLHAKHTLLSRQMDELLFEVHGIKSISAPEKIVSSLQRVTVGEPEYFSGPSHNPNFRCPIFDAYGTKTFGPEAHSKVMAKFLAQQQVNREPHNPLFSPSYTKDSYLSAPNHHLCLTITTTVFAMGFFVVLLVRHYQLLSQINGNNGSWTNTDDVQRNIQLQTHDEGNQEAIERQLSQAKHKLLEGAQPGTLHYDKMPTRFRKHFDLGKLNFLYDLKNLVQDSKHPLPPTDQEIEEFSVVLDPYMRTRLNAKRDALKPPALNRLRKITNKEQHIVNGNFDRDKAGKPIWNWDKEGHYHDLRDPARQLDHAIAAGSNPATIKLPVGSSSQSMGPSNREMHSYNGNPPKMGPRTKAQTERTQRKRARNRKKRMETKAYLSVIRSGAGRFPQNRRKLPAGVKAAGAIEKRELAIARKYSSFLRNPVFEPPRLGSTGNTPTMLVHGYYRKALSMAAPFAAVVNATCVSVSINPRIFKQFTSVTDYVCPIVISMTSSGSVVPTIANATGNVLCEAFANETALKNQVLGHNTVGLASPLGRWVGGSITLECRCPMATTAPPFMFGGLLSEYPASSIISGVIKPDSQLSSFAIDNIRNLATSVEVPGFAVSSVYVPNTPNSLNFDAHTACYSTTNTQTITAIPYVGLTNCPTTATIEVTVSAWFEVQQNVYYSSGNTVSTGDYAGWAIGPRVSSEDIFDNIRRTPTVSTRMIGMGAKSSSTLSSFAALAAARDKILNPPEPTLHEEIMLLREQYERLRVVIGDSKEPDELKINTSLVVNQDDDYAKISPPVPTRAINQEPSLHQVKSQINGNQGSWTNSDDTMNVSQHTSVDETTLDPPPHPPPNHIDTNESHSRLVINHLSLFHIFSERLPPDIVEQIMFFLQTTTANQQYRQFLQARRLAFASFVADDLKQLDLIYNESTPCVFCQDMGSTMGTPNEFGHSSLVERTLGHGPGCSNEVFSYGDCAYYSCLASWSCGICHTEHQHKLCEDLTPCDCGVMFGIAKLRYEWFSAAEGWEEHVEDIYETFDLLRVFLDGMMDAFPDDEQLNYQLDGFFYDGDKRPVPYRAVICEQINGNNGSATNTDDVEDVKDKIAEDVKDEIIVPIVTTPEVENILFPRCSKCAKIMRLVNGRAICDFCKVPAARNLAPVTPNVVSDEDAYDKAPFFRNQRDYEPITKIQTRMINRKGQYKHTKSRLEKQYTAAKERVKHMKKPFVPEANVRVQQSKVEQKPVTTDVVKINKELITSEIITERQLVIDLLDKESTTGKAYVTTLRCRDNIANIKNRDIVVTLEDIIVYPSLKRHYDEYGTLTFTGDKARTRVVKTPYGLCGVLRSYLSGFSTLEGETSPKSFDIFRLHCFRLCKQLQLDPYVESDVCTYIPQHVWTNYLSEHRSSNPFSRLDLNEVGFITGRLESISQVLDTISDDSYVKCGLLDDGYHNRLPSYVPPFLTRLLPRWIDSSQRRVHRELLVHAKRSQLKLFNLPLLNCSITEDLLRSRRNMINCLRFFPKLYIKSYSRPRYTRTDQWDPMENLSYHVGYLKPPRSADYVCWSYDSEPVSQISGNNGSWTNTDDVHSKNVYRFITHKMGNLRPKSKENAYYNYPIETNKISVKDSNPQAQYALFVTHDYRPVCYANTLENEEATMMHRVVIATPQHDEVFMNKFVTFSKTCFRAMMNGRVKKIYAVSNDKYLERSNASSSVKEQIRKAFIDLQRLGINVNSKLDKRTLHLLTNRGLFLKKENLSYRTPLGIKHKTARAIMSAPAWFIALVGPWFMALQDHFKRVWHKNNWCCFVSGVSARDTAKLIDQMWMLVEDDVATFDSSVSRPLCEFEVWVAQQFGCPSLIVQLMLANCDTHGYSYHGAKFFYPGGRKSGDPYTSLFNSMLNAFMHVFIIKEKTGWNLSTLRDNVRMLVCGDDNVMAINTTQIIPFVVSMSMLGFNSEALYRDSIHEVEFCSCRVYYDDDGPFFGPMPGKVLSKFGFVNSPPDDVSRESMLRGIALGLKETCYYLPPIRAVVDRVLTLTDGTTPYVDRSTLFRQEEWHMRFYTPNTSYVNDISIYASLMNTYGWDPAKQSHLEVVLSRCDFDSVINDPYFNLLCDHDSAGPQVSAA